jgi:IMP dehydrogenase
MTNILSTCEALTYDDVLLVPQYSDIESRKEVDIGNNLDDSIRLDLPVISSPMDTVTEVDMAEAVGMSGGLGILHRYNTIEIQCQMALKLWELPVLIGAAVGVTGDYLERATQLAHSGVRVICIDVAHGHHFLMERAIKTIRDALDGSVHIMAGNVATREGFEALSDWGADSVRCNVGGGSICSTRIQTGHGMPGLQTIFDCAQSDRNTKIIADGGIRNSGDIVKALAAGADFVMLGSMLAGTDESPGFVIEDINGGQYKLYRGMASKEAQVEWRGEYSSNEGVSTKIPFKGQVASVFQDIKNGISSGLSYSGARTVSELWGKAKWVRQTSSGLKESATHILYK